MLEAMESSVGGRLSNIHCGAESSDEELSVLPRHTKVVVTGNNRTKSVLVGLQGVVKKAVGLGGWHWLVLTNGIEVKLQRNALSVIEPPSRNEGDDMASDGAQESNRPGHWIHGLPSSSHSTSQSLSGDSHAKGSICTPYGSNKVDLSKLDTSALWRYWQHFNLVHAMPNPTEEQLVDAVQRHFMSQQMDELQVVVGFVHAAKRMKTSCRLP